jgi:chromosome segregation ATPase
MLQALCVSEELTMGAIKDLIDLVTQLNSSVEDRKFAGELRQVQSMIGAIQSEHAEIHEQRIALMTENAELKQKIAGLKEEILALKQRASESGTAASSSIDKEEERILLYLTKVSEATAQQIANVLEQTPTKTEFWVNRLCESEKLYAYYAVNSPVTYSLEQAGREYLVLNDLV